MPALLEQQFGLQVATQLQADGATWQPRTAHRTEVAGSLGGAPLTLSPRLHAWLSSQGRGQEGNAQTWQTSRHLPSLSRDLWEPWVSRAREVWALLAMKSWETQVCLGSVQYPPELPASMDAAKVKGNLMAPSGRGPHRQHHQLPRTDPHSPRGKPSPGHTSPCA